MARILPRRSGARQGARTSERSGRHASPLDAALASCLARSSSRATASAVCSKGSAMGRPAPSVRGQHARIGQGHQSGPARWLALSRAARSTRSAWSAETAERTVMSAWSLQDCVYDGVLLAYDPSEGRQCRTKWTCRIWTERATSRSRTARRPLLGGHRSSDLEPDSKLPPTRELAAEAGSTTSPPRGCTASSPSSAT